MAVQRSKAEDVVAKIFGDWVRGQKYFWFADAEIAGIPLKIQRSGYSRQGGFEFYLMDGSRGTDLWNIVREAGQPWGIGPGGPNPVERIESGLLSYGGDTDDTTNPFEVRLGKYENFGLDDTVVGIKALRAIHASGVKWHQVGIVLDDQPRQPGHAIWYDVYKDGQLVGQMTDGGWSPRKRTMIVFGLVQTNAVAGDRIIILRDGKPESGTICELPFY